jgi:hypothetical protein
LLTRPVVRFADMQPSRRFRTRKGQRHLPGRWWPTTDGRHVGYESWPERDQVMWLDWDQTVTGIASQPFRLWWTTGEGKAPWHVPDYFAKRGAGPPVVVGHTAASASQARAAEHRQERRDLLGRAAARSFWPARLPGPGCSAHPSSSALDCAASGHRSMAARRAVACDRLRRPLTRHHSHGSWRLRGRQEDSDLRADPDIVTPCGATWRTGSHRRNETCRWPVWSSRARPRLQAGSCWSPTTAAALVRGVRPSGGMRSQCGRATLGGG